MSRHRVLMLGGPRDGERMVFEPVEHGHRVRVTIPEESPPFNAGSAEPVTFDLKLFTYRMVEFRTGSVRQFTAVPDDTPDYMALILLIEGYGVDKTPE